MISTLVGRDLELSSVRALLASDGVRLLTVTGAGGVGKTRLALEIARTAGPSFPHGVHFANLSALTDPAAVAQVVGHAVGFQQGSGSLDLRVADFVKDRQLLLVLDNFENVLDASAWLQALLEASPRLKVLVTSRAPLKVKLESIFELRPLALLRAGASVDQICNNEAVRLLVENARVPDFKVDPSNAAALAAICQRLDGLPLAIELAARQLGELGATELLARLEATSLPLLAEGRRGRAPRHRTLRETIDWSFKLLSPEEQSGFAALGVFPEDFTAEAAAQVVGDEALPELLRTHHLLERAGDRFRFLRTVRDFSREVVEPAALANAQALHAAYFSKLGREVAARIEVSVTAEDLNLLERELPNFRAALDWHQRSEAWEVGLELAVALSRFFDMRGYWVEATGWLSLFCEKASAKRLVGRALTWAGTIRFRQGDFESAGGLHEKSLALARETGDELGALDAIDRLQWVKMYQGKLAEGAKLADQGWELAQRLGDPRRQARAIGQRAWIDFEQGRRAAAEEQYTHAVTLLEADGDAGALSYMLNALGEVQRSRGHFPEARASYLRSLNLAKEVGIKRQMAPCAGNLAMVARQTGDRAGEITWLLESLRLTLEIGNLTNLPLNLIALANLCAMKGQPRVGAQVFGAAEALLIPRGGVVGFADKDDHTTAASLLRAHLGQAEFEKLRAEGLQISADAAIRLAIEAMALEARIA